MVRISTKIKVAMKQAVNGVVIQGIATASTLVDTLIPSIPQDIPVIQMALLLLLAMVWMDISLAPQFI